MSLGRLTVIFESSIVKGISHILTVLVLTSCEGIFQGIYDDGPTEQQQPSVAPKNATEGKLYVDASDWTKWHYIDLKAAIADTDSTSTTEWTVFDIPTQAVTGQDSRAGIYNYWYDVFGLGISNHEFRSFTPTAPQPEPPSWTIAVHRNNVRTNGGAVIETDFSSIAHLPDDISSIVQGKTFAEDEWDELNVWTVQSQMLSGIIGNQGININKQLSSWLRVDIPPMPPVFTLNNHVFILRLADGTYAALQLENYQSQKGVKCYLTINYKYPLQ
jgi:hypothetical protein